MKPKTTRMIRDEAKLEALMQRAEMYDRRDSLEEDEKRRLEAHDAQHTNLFDKYVLKNGKK